MAASNAKRDKAAEGAGQELVLTRVFDAPRDPVFRAWTEPERLAKWWGPAGFTNPVCEVDVRPGGAIRIDMQAPDGTVYPMTGVFHEVAPPDRLVFTATAMDHAGNGIFDVLNTVTFAEFGGKTELTLRAKVVKATPGAERYLSGMEEGWSQSLVRLGELTEQGSDRELVATRVFDAPRDLVFEMWTDPKHIVHWWGPRGFTNTIEQMDVRPGGEWRFVMHGPDGRNYQNKIVYGEIAKPERLTYTHVSTPLFRSTVTFTERGGRTAVTVRMLFETAAERTNVIEKFGAAEGLRQTLERLGEQVAKAAGRTSREFSISREFDAPRELVFRAWTEAERLMHWWGPKGFRMLVAKLDLRPGGVFLYGMESPDGKKVWGRFVYREITPPERLVFVVSFSDEAGGVTRHPFAPEWPAEVLSTITFEERDGRTTVTVRGVAIHATEAERKVFEGGFDSMRQGWTGTMDQLAGYVASAAL